MHANKPLLSIRVLDLDPQRGAAVADSLRRLAREHSLAAEIWSVGCMMEIARWGLAGKTPALLVDGHAVCAGGPISEGMLERLVHGILAMQAASAGASSPSNTTITTGAPASEGRKPAAHAPSTGGVFMFTPLTTANYKESIAATENGVLICFKKLCPHCKNMEKVLEKFAAKQPGLSLFQLDSEEEPEAFKDLGGERAPTIVGIKGGKVAAVKAGLMNPREMEAWYRTI